VPRAALRLPNVGLIFIASDSMRATSKRPAWSLLTQHWLSLLGLALLATALISWFPVLPRQVRGHVGNPYVNISVFLVLPALFFTGLALVPIGVHLSKRRIREPLAEGVFDRKTALGRIVLFLGAATVLNILLEFDPIELACAVAVSSSA
jgi:hypothetical protein